jgi:predicted alpha/beta hydrolase family esterase
MKTVFIFHGTEGYPEENWFPWLKEKLEAKGYQVFVPQFPTQPIIPAKIEEWFAVLEKYQEKINQGSIIIGHSLGGIFALRVLEKLEQPIKAAIFTGTPIGIKPLFNYERDGAFSGFKFNWQKIREMANHFAVFQSDDDPYVSLENGKQLSQELGVELSFIPNAGHFNKKAGYTTFKELLTKFEEIEKL